MATTEQLAKETDSFYSWHGHITKVDGHNTIVLMNKRTMYSLMFRNKLPRNKDKFTKLVLDVIPFTLEVNHVNQAEIDCIRKKGKEYIVPFEEMLKELCMLSVIK